MNRKKGFTLIELLGVIILLGIILTIAVVAYSSSLNKTKVKAFKLEEGNFVDATKSAYVDCLSNNPSNTFCRTHQQLEEKYTYEFIYLKELIDDKYIEEIKNPYDVEQFCDVEKSYVYVSRKNSSQADSSDMVYKACLICGDHKSENCLDDDLDYSSFDTTCTAYYDVNSGELYDGKWTDKNVYLVFGASGNYRYGINEFEYTINDSSTNTITANNSNTATLNLKESVGNKTYKVQAFDGMNGKGTIVSCGANIKIDKGTVNSVSISAKTTSGLTVKSDEWSKENVILNANVNPSTSTSGYLYQWYKNGQKYGSQTEASTLSVTGQGTYKVEVTNKLGKIVKTSNEFIVKIDTKKPTCTLAVSGTTGENDIYTSNVNISFKTVSDMETSIEEGSGIVSQTIDYKTITDNVKDKVITGTVTDGVGRTNTCTVTITKDDETPSTPILTISDNISSDNWHTADFTITPTGASNVSGNTYYYGTTTNPTTATNKLTVNTNSITSSGIKYYFKVCSKAGLCSDTLSYVAKLDKTTPSAPTLEISDNITSENWHKEPFIITASGANNISGNTYYYGTTASPNIKGDSISFETNTTAVTYYFKVCSGSGLCSINSRYVAKLDKTEPTITTNASSNYITTTTNKDITDYFDITYGISSGTTVCKVGTTEVANTNDLSLGVNTVTCTVTGGSGYTDSASTIFKHQYTANASCNSGDSLTNITTCSHTYQTGTSYSCSSGHSLNGITCSYTPSYSCPAGGSLEGTSCVQSASCSTYQCSVYKECTLYSMNGYCTYTSGGTTTNTSQCFGTQTGADLSTLGTACETQCKKACNINTTGGYSYSCPYATGEKGRYSQCGTETVTGSLCNTSGIGVSGKKCTQYTCGQDWTLNGTSCTSGATAECKNGGTLDGHSCKYNATATPTYTTETYTPSYSCPDGGDLVGTTCSF